jgi:hypothetical protein
MEVAIIIGAIIQVITLSVFFVMAANVAKIRTLLDAISRRSVNFDENVITAEGDSDSLPEGLLVVDLKTEKQMRLGDKLDNGKYRCYSDGLLVGEFSEEEIMEFDKWVKEVYKK